MVFASNFYSVCNFNQSKCFSYAFYTVPIDSPNPNLDETNFYLQIAAPLTNGNVMLNHFNMAVFLILACSGCK